METIPINARIMNASSPEDEPPRLCPDCEQDDQQELDPRRRAIVEWIMRKGHSEDEAREIERRMMDKVRREFSLPREDGPEPQREN